MKKILFLLLTVALFSACSEREQISNKFTFPTTPPALALFSILTPGDSVFVWVSSLYAIPDQPQRTVDYAKVSDAIITLQNNISGQVVNLPYLGRGGFYGTSQKKFPIIAGAIYSIKGSRPGFPNIQAVCRIPLKAAVIEKFSYGNSYDTGSILSGGNGMRRRYEARWQGTSTSGDSVNYFFATKYKFDGDTFTQAYYDEQITQAGSTYFYQNDVGDDPNPRYYYVITVTPELFAFYRINRAGKFGGSNFFGGYQGVIPEYTNVQGGQGVFGGYLSSYIIAAFK